MHCYFNSRLCMRGNGFLPRFHYRWKISIHASAWEATLVYILDSTDWIFQFTPLHERQLLCHVDWDFIIISIHASAWEATFFTIISAVLTVFQFTPLHERQLKTELEGGVKEYFNSRLCMRGNVAAATASLTSDLISIHASAWEATCLA